jgi:hypothetical protein
MMASKPNVSLHSLITSPRLDALVSLGFADGTDKTKHKCACKTAVSMKTNVPLPSQKFNHTVRKMVDGLSFRNGKIAKLDVSQRVRERPRIGPGHSKHNMYRDAERLRAVYVRKAGRVGNDGVGDERDGRDGVGLDARPPEAAEHLGHHPALLLDVTGAQALHAGDEARVLHHVRHQLDGVAADGVELEPGVAHELVKDVVRRQPHPVPVLLELVAERDEGLHIAAAADDLDDDVGVPAQE